MTRFVHQNSIGGRLSVDLTDVATSMESEALVALLTLASGDGVYPVTLDPDGQFGAPEVVYITAHTFGTNAADILREPAGEGSTARLHPAGTAWALGGTAGWAEAMFSRLPAREETTTARTLSLLDAGTVVECTNASQVTITVPDNATVDFPEGSIVNVYAAGAGGVVFAGGTGVTIRNVVDLVQYQECSLRYRGGDEWVLVGAEEELAAVTTIGAKAVRTSDQSIPNSTETAVTFDTEVRDDGGMYDDGGVEDRLTVPAGGDGWYVITGWGSWNTSGTGERQLIIVCYTSAGAGKTAGSANQGEPSNPGAIWIHQNVSMVQHLVAGDYIQLRAFQASGAALNLRSGAHLEAVRVAAT